MAWKKPHFGAIVSMRPPGCAAVSERSDGGGYLEHILRGDPATTTVPRPVEARTNLDTSTEFTGIQPKQSDSSNLAKPDNLQYAETMRLEAHKRTRINSQILSRNEVDEKPWKYIGYQGYTDFIASENDFFVVRRFASVSARIALSLQDQVSILEEQLNGLDIKHSRRDGDDVNNGSFRDDDPQRTKLLELLRVKILQYNEFILQQEEIKKHPEPSAQDLKSLLVWHGNHQNRAIDIAEQAYLEHTRDLFSVVPKDKTPLRRLLERSRSFRLHWFWKEDKPYELPMYDQGNVNYISDKKIDRFVTALIIILGMAMLIAPMWVLEFLSKPVTKLGTITAFIVVFLGMISYASVAKPFEVLAATAAYSAVLMVFLQLNAPIEK